MSQDNDKRELLKLKQGIIDSSESIDESGYDLKMPQTAAEKVKNYLWYARWIILLIVIAAGLMTAVYFMFLNKPKADITIYSANSYTGTTVAMLSESMQHYCRDINEDGKAVVEINQSVQDDALSTLDLYREITDGSAQIIIGTKAQLTGVYEDILKAENTEIFANLENLGVDIAEGYVIDIKETAYGKALQIYSTEIYFAVRNTGDVAMENAVEFLTDIVSGKQYV